MQHSKIRENLNHFIFFAGKESEVYKDNSMHQKVLRTFYYHFL